MKNRTITVCDKCLQASCWLGIFMCDQSRYAGTVEKTLPALQTLALEDPHYWREDAASTVRI